MLNIKEIMRNFGLIIFVAFIPFVSKGQELLTLEKAIKIGLDNSYSIKIARNNAEIAKINNTIGNAGFLPKADLSANQSVISQNRHFEMSDNTNLDEKNYGTNALSAVLQLNWTVFDGFSMFARADKLKMLEQQGEMKLKMEIENLVSNIVETYFLIAQNEKLYKWYLNQLELSRERLNISREKVEIGVNSGLQQLQAEVDYRTDSSQMLMQRNRVSALKSNLNRLLNRDPEVIFSVSSNFPIPSEKNLNSVFERLSEQNYNILIAKMEHQITQYELKEAKSLRYPTVYISGAYNFSNTSTPKGTTELSRIFGPQVGIGASLTLFNGFNNSRKIDIARIVSENQRLVVEDLTSNLRHVAFNLVNELSRSIELVNVEEKLVELAERNVSIGMEKFKLGAISDFELREIQNKLTEAQNRYINALTSAQQFEIEILTLTSELDKYMHD